MAFDTTSLQQKLATDIAAATGTLKPDEVLSFVSALDNLTTNRFVSVPTYNDLPDLTLTPLPSGSLILVESLDIMMMAVGNQWRGIDSRPPQLIAYGWGVNSFGVLGDNTTTIRSSPVTVVGGITNWKQVSTSQHSLGISISGVAYAWGSNASGRLGDGTTSSRSSPVTVVGGITNWKQLSAAAGLGTHSLGVTTSGIAYAWGSNSAGRLGDGTTSSRSSPVTVIGGITTWSQVAGGRDHSLGLTSSGLVYAWGYNNFGQLGDNTTSTRVSPITVIGGITTWSQVTSGSRNSLAGTSAGIAYSWGYNNNGRLGDGTATTRSSPVTVVGGITNWKQLSAHNAHALGVTTSGIAYGWGNNGGGRVGDNTTTSRLSPVTIAGGITNWSQLAAGYNHSTGFTSSGVLYAWGYNLFGAIGDNTTINKSSPVTVVGVNTNWNQISSGDNNNIAITIR